MKISAPFNFKSNFKNLIFKPLLKIENLKLKIFFPLLAFLFFIFYFSFTSTSFAQDSNTNSNNPVSQSTQTNPYTAPNTTPDVPQNLHTYSQNVLLEVMAAVACQLSGIDPTTASGKCLGFDTTTGRIGYVDANGGAIGFMGGMIAMLYTPPTHTREYIKHLASNFGITKSAQAAIPAESGATLRTGTGFDGLKPLLPLWTVFRNIVYILFVLVFVIIGVAIMLRLKIDPRTVMTVQNQIPKLIIGILLVTFSFSIAGFLIDIMYTSIYLIGGAVESAAPNTLGVDNTTVKLVQAENPLDAGNIVGVAGGASFGLANIAGTPAKTIGKFIASAFDNTEGKVVLTVLQGLIGGYIGSKAGGFLGGLINTVKGPIGKWAAGLICATGAGATTGGLGAPAAGLACSQAIGRVFSIGGTVVGAAAGVGATAFFGNAIVKSIISLIAFLIILIAVLWALIRLWFALITAYIMILLDIVFAPFWIVAGLVPGSKLTFGNWVRDIISNLAAFVAAIVMFLLGRAFIDAFGAAGTSGQFVPPLITNPVSTKSIGAIIGLGIILTTPTVVQMMKSMFAAPKLDISGFGTAMGVGMGVTRVPSQLGMMAYHWSMMRYVPFVNKLSIFRQGNEEKSPKAPPTPPPVIGRTQA